MVPIVHCDVVPEQIQVHLHKRPSFSHYLRFLVASYKKTVLRGELPHYLLRFLVASYKKACYVANFLFFFLCLLLPIILYASGAIFDAGAFGLWIMIFLLWCFVGGLSVIVLPVLDFNKELKEAKTAGVSPQKFATLTAKNIEDSSSSSTAVTSKNSPTVAV